MFFAAVTLKCIGPSIGEKSPLTKKLPATTTVIYCFSVLLFPLLFARLTHNAFMYFFFVRLASWKHFAWASLNWSLSSHCYIFKKRFVFDQILTLFKFACPIYLFWFPTIYQYELMCMLAVFRAPHYQLCLMMTWHLWMMRVLATNQPSWLMKRTKNQHPNNIF